MRRRVNLSEDEISDIRKKLMDRVPYSQIARRYGISQHCVADLRREFGIEPIRGVGRAYTDEDVRFIRRMMDEETPLLEIARTMSFSPKRIARDFDYHGVDPATVSRLNLEKRYAVPRIREAWPNVDFGARVL